MYGQMLCCCWKTSLTCIFSNFLQLLIKKRKPAWMSFSWVNHSLPQYFMTVHLPKTSPNISNLSYRFEKSDTEVVFYVRFRSCDFNPKILQTNTIITSTGGVYVLFSLFIPELHWSCSVLRSDCVCTGQLPGVSVCNCVNVLRAFLQMRGLLSEKHPWIIKG